MNKQNAREAILDVAENLIQTQGYNAFSFRDIAKVIGIKTSSIHYHFPTKEELGKAAIMRHIDELHTSLVSIMENPTTNYIKKLHLFFDGVFAKTYAANRKMCLGGMMASDVLTLPEAMQYEVRMFFQRLEAWLEELLKKGKSNNEFHFKGSAKQQANYTLCLLEGALLLARLFHDESSIRIARKQIEEQLLLK